MYVPQETPIIISIYVLYINVYLFIIMETCTDNVHLTSQTHIFIY